MKPENTKEKWGKLHKDLGNFESLVKDVLDLTVLTGKNSVWTKEIFDKVPNVVMDFLKVLEKHHLYRTSVVMAAAAFAAHVTDEIDRLALESCDSLAVAEIESLLKHSLSNRSDTDGK